MKKLSLLSGLLYLLSCLYSCQKSDTFELKGDLQEMTGDVLFLIYDDPDPKIDTIYPRKGKFEYAFVPDTLCLMRLTDESGNIIPVFADKGWEVRLKGKLDKPTIEGDGYNKEYQEFLTQANATDSRQKQEAMAETFIKSHPQSFVSAYLINQYFVQKPEPDEQKIEELIEPLEGKVKDSRILGMVIKSLPTKKGNKQNDNYISYYSARLRDGKYLSWNTQKGQFTLVNFWATWDKKSVTLKDSLYQLTKNFKEKEFRILNISLDYDKKAWERNCKEDSEQWIELCDAKGWNSTLVRQKNINEIPANILVNPGRKIVARNIYGNDLKKKLHELTEENRK